MRLDDITKELAELYKDCVDKLGDNTLRYVPSRQNMKKHLRHTAISGGVFVGASVVGLPIVALPALVVSGVSGYKSFKDSQLPADDVVGRYMDKDKHDSRDHDNYC